MTIHTQKQSLKRKNSDPHQPAPRPCEPVSPLITSLRSISLSPTAIPNTPSQIESLKRKREESPTYNSKRNRINAPKLPLELIHAIITYAIQSHNDDPTYQWTVLRHITRFHCKEIENHFQVFWLPKLHVTVYPCPNSRLNFEYQPCDSSSEQESGHRKPAKFVAQLELSELLWCRSHGKEKVETLVRLGEGILNEGYAGGGIVSDAIVPELREEEMGKYVYFDWKMLFDNVFTEEMVMREAIEKLINVYAQGPLHTRQQASADPAEVAKQRLALVHFLRTDVQIRLRCIVHTHRAKHQPQNNISKPWDPFNLALPFHQPRFNYRTGLPVFPAILRETSVIFMIPGWRSLGIRELARLRGEEARRNCSENNGRWYIAHVTYKSPEMLKGWIGRRALNGKKSVRCWEGKEISEEALEEQLRIRDHVEKHWSESGVMFSPEHAVQRVYCD